LDSTYIGNIENLDLDKSTAYIDELTLLFLILVILKQEFIQRELLNITTENLNANIKNINKVINSIYDFFKEKNIELEKMKDYKPILKFLAGVFAMTNDYNGNIKSAIDKWFWNTLVYNRYPGAQNERVARDF